MEKYNITEKHAIVHVLELIMQADTIIHPSEISYMDDVYDMLGVTQEIMDHMELMDWNSAKRIIREMTKQQQEEVKQIFKTMAVVDGFVDKREQIVIDNIF